MGLRVRGDRLELEIADGRKVIVPLEFYPSLVGASAKERNNWEYWPYATAIEWPDLDLQLSVESIIAGRHEHVPPPGWRESMEADLKRLGLSNKPPTRNARKAA